MRVSEAVKSYGFKSLKVYAEFVQVPETTLRDWYKNKHRLFNIVLAGAINLRDKNERNKIQ